jgi:hypothetical protein
MPFAERIEHLQFLADWKRGKTPTVGSLAFQNAL